MVILNGTIRCYGIFFVEIMSFLHASSSVGSIVLSLPSATYTLSVFFVLNCFTQLTTHRTLILIGSVFITAAFILESFSSTIVLLGASHSLVGIGMSFTYGPSVVIVGHYFKKYRGSANAIASCGSCIGQFSLAPLITYLISEYGIQGALLLQAGILSHCFFLGFLLRPTDFYRRHLSQCELPLIYDEANVSSLNRNGEISVSDVAINNLNSVHTKEEDVKEKIGKLSNNNHNNLLKMIPIARKIENRRNTDLCIKFSPVNTDDKISDASMCYSSHSITETGMLPTFQKPRDFAEHFQKSSAGTGTGSISLHIQHSVKPNYFGDSMMGFGSAVSLQDESVSNTHARALMNICKNSILQDDGVHTGFIKEPSKLETLLKSLKLIFKNVDLSLLKLKLYILFVLGYTFGGCGSAIIHNYFPARANDLGLSRDQSTVILLFSGSADIIARIITCLIADHRRMHRTGFVSCVLCINGIMCLSIMLYTTYVSFVLFTIVYGLCCGVFFAINTTILTDFIGLKKLSQGLGMSYLVFGLGATAVFPVIGCLRDISGTYDYAFMLNGILLLTSGILFSLESCVKKWDRKSQNDSSNT